MKKTKCLVLIDGEHYPPVIAQGLKIAERDYGYHIVGGVFLGGTEKIGKKKDLDILNIPLVIEDDIVEGVKKGMTKFQPDLVLDLSDEPVVGYKERFKIANCVIKEGVHYKGSDYDFYPPKYEDIVRKPSVMIGGTGKRVGKTAIGAFTARFLKGQEKFLKKNHNPCIITMGRGGPEHPEIIQGHEIKMNTEYFLQQSLSGKHAASDHYEDALMSRVRTIGCRRCGGGFSGEAFYSIVKEGAKIANKMDNDFLIFEGSGATNPPIKTDTCIMIIGANQPLNYISGYMGPLRIMIADLIIITMCEEPMANLNKIQEIENSIKDISSDVSVIKTVFRPKPLGKVDNKKVVLCTTAPGKIGKKLKEYLEKNYNCQVIGMTHKLSNRPDLKRELKLLINSRKTDVLLTEVKAASIDVVTKIGVEKGIDVIYVDNIPKVVQGEQEELNQAMINIMKLTTERFRRRWEDIKN